MVLSLPTAARAAVEYAITIDSAGNPITPHRALHVTVDGPRRRVEIRTPEKNPVAFDVFIADLDRRPGFTGVNTDLKTWWYPASPSVSVDAMIASKLGIVEGFPLRTIVASSRAYAGGMPQHEEVTANVSDYRTARSEPRLFEIPKGCVEQKTVIAGPGALSHY